MEIDPKKRLKRYKGVLYDTGTKNKSFLQVAMDLKALGRKNFYFMLQLNDPTLINVDPYADNLTNDQVTRILFECRNNIWYYLREVARIPSQGGQPVPYKANRGNIAQTWCILHGIDSWLCLPRQQGKTQSVLAVFSWAYNFGTNDSVFIFVNKDGSNAKENLQRMKDQIDCLPKYMHFDQILEEDDETGKMKVVKAVKNATSMKHPITKNRVIIKSKATSYESALSLARGLTAPFLHFDEPEFTNQIKAIVANSVSTFETAARNARANGALYGRVFSCTPGDLDTSFGMEAQELLSQTAKWTERMYDMQWDPKNDDNELKNYIAQNGSNGIVYIEYSYKQIGLDDKWLRAISDKIGDPLVVKREILLQRLRGSSDSPFSQEDIEYITSVMCQPTDELYLLDTFRLDIYEPFNKRTPYLVGVDCATGTNGDNNAITIIDPYTVKPVAEFKCPYIGETLYEKLLIELVQKVIPKAIVIIERNSVGDGIIDHLMNSPINHRLYFDKNKDLVNLSLEEQSTIVSMLKKRGEEKKYYGVYTEGNSRESMMAILIRHVAEFKDNFVTKNITEDISRLVRNKAGKILAGGNFHDDSVMSYLIAMYVYYHGNNLGVFGFVKGSNEIENQNQGLDYSYEAVKNKDILPERIVNTIQKQEAVKKENDYAEIYRRAVLGAQRDSMVLTNRGLVNNSVLNSTPDFMLEDSMDEGEIDMSLFDELNGL